MFLKILKIIGLPISIIVFALSLVVSSIATFADLGQGVFSTIEGIVLIILNPLAYLLIVMSFISEKFIKRSYRPVLAVIFANIFLIVVLYIHSILMANMFGESETLLLFLIPQIIYLFWAFPQRENPQK
ncbi:MAG: hypothetical protein OXU73_01425 [Candidatus Campbellbacteria bacterium]|nr:hypothetical protein [Candidatus Campbellbacteria bacterium]